MNHHVCTLVWPFSQFLAHGHLFFSLLLNFFFQRSHYACGFFPRSLKRICSSNSTPFVSVLCQHPLFSALLDCPTFVLQKSFSFEPASQRLVYCIGDTFHFMQNAPALSLLTRVWRCNKSLFIVTFKT